jgi:hypothetical protein
MDVATLALPATTPVANTLCRATTVVVADAAAADIARRLL